MADNLLLLAQYPKQVVVRDRNYAGLLAWSNSMMAQEVPETPDEDWVRLRLIAGRIPQQIAAFVERTFGYFLQDPATVTNIREFLHPWNDEGVEVSLSAQISGVISTFMPRMAAAEVTDAQVVQWYRDNGFEPPEELVQRAQRGGAASWMPGATPPPMPPPAPAARGNA